MKVTLSEFKNLQRFVYDGEQRADLIPLYVEFVEFCGTKFLNPTYVKLVGGLTDLDVEGN